MELKRILARDSRSANEKAMQLYGDDVLIISTQRVGDQTELIVAIDGQASASSKTTEAPPLVVDEAAQQEKNEVFAEIFGFVQRQEQAQPIPPTEATVQPKAAKKTRKAVAQGSTTSKQSKPKATSGEWPEWLQQEMTRSREIVDVLRQEIHILRQEMGLARQIQPWQNQLNLAPDLLALVDTMTHLGVPVGLRAMLTETIAASSDPQNAIDAMRQVLLGSLKQSPGRPFEPGVHVMVGAPGVGKTCMAIRCIHGLMSDTLPEDHVVIGFADHRPGAWSQLQMLAAGIGVEAYRAKDQEALGVLLTELSDRPYLWIDTPGQPYFEMASFFAQEHPKARLHAVVPMDASATHLQRLRQCPHPWEGILISKAEDLHATWSWLQLLSEQPLHIQGLSSDANIKTPLQAFDLATWVESALGMLAPSNATSKLSQSAPSRPKRARSQKVGHA